MRRRVGLFSWRFFFNICRNLTSPLLALYNLNQEIILLVIIYDSFIYLFLLIHKYKGFIMAILFVNKTTSPHAILNL